MPWVSRFTRIIAIIPLTLAIDVALFVPNRNGQPFVGPYPWWIIVAIVLIELGVEVSLIWVAYRRGLDERKLTWQKEHPEGLTGMIPATASSPS